MKEVLGDKEEKGMISSRMVVSQCVLTTGASHYAGDVDGLFVEGPMEVKVIGTEGALSTAVARRAGQLQKVPRMGRGTFGTWPASLPSQRLRGRRLTTSPPHPPAVWGSQQGGRG